MELRITILCENSVILPFNVIGEHGFAAYIETPNGNFLFDTGQGKGIIPNALALKKDLTQIKFLFLSHGHFDHTGGLFQILSLKNPLKIYAHPEIFGEKYSIIPQKPPLFVGIPFRKELLVSMGAQFEFIKNWKEIDNNIFFTGEVPKKSLFKTDDENLKILDETGRMVTDPLKDDNSIIIDTSKGLVVILGCAHAGIINILNYAVEKTGKDKIYALIGGTHLGFSPEGKIANIEDEYFHAVLKTFEKYKIEKIGASHCTGLKASSMLSYLLKDKFFFASVGSFLEI